MPACCRPRGWFHVHGTRTPPGKGVSKQRACPVHVELPLAGSVLSADWLSVTPLLAQCYLMASAVLSVFWLSLIGWLVPCYPLAGSVQTAGSLQPTGSVVSACWLRSVSPLAGSIFALAPSVIVSHSTKQCHSSKQN